MQKGIKFRIYPNKEQQLLINRTLGCCRLIYNKGLAMRNEAYKKNERTSYTQTSAMLTELKRHDEYAFLKEADSVAPVSYTHLFSYTFNGTHYCEQTTQNLPYKELNEKMTVGNLYPIYINPKHPAVFVLSKKIKLSTTLIIMFGLIILLCGIFYYFINPIL